MCTYIKIASTKLFLNICNYMFNYKNNIINTDSSNKILVIAFIKLDRRVYIFCSVRQLSLNIILQKCYLPRIFCKNEQHYIHIVPQQNAHIHFLNSLSTHTVL